MSLFALGVLASLAAGVATGVGALPLLMVRKLSDDAQNIFLGFAAGVMLAAAFFSLLIPALDAAEIATGSETTAALIVVAAVLLGAAALHLLNAFAPHEHFLAGHHGADAPALGRVWLFVIAITLHNIPEGLAVGVSYGVGAEKGGPVALGIGLQNMPEGLAVAASLAAFYPRRFAVGLALATGLVEPVAAALGLGAVSLATGLLPWGLGFAAGAMIWVVSSEIIPETHRENRQGLSTAALMVGLVSMMFLDVVFG
ncbi:ZIP family metal transporter [Phenylobacterium sp.]|uniref:ZIP family metal transporter n=1 Tax=Phenylobacterium sp. TaxID=1871053 RepID=UPI0035B0F2B3